MCLCQTLQLKGDTKLIGLHRDNHGWKVKSHLMAVINLACWPTRSFCHKVGSHKLLNAIWMQQIFHLVHRFLHQHLKMFTMTSIFNDEHCKCVTFGTCISIVQMHVKCVLTLKNNENNCNNIGLPYWNIKKHYSPTLKTELTRAHANELTFKMRVNFWILTTLFDIQQPQRFLEFSLLSAA